MGKVYQMINAMEAKKFLANSKTGTEPVWFKTNGNTPSNADVDNIYVNGRWVKVYRATDAGKVTFKYDADGKKTDVYGYSECKVAYVLN
jgi:DNA-binding PadR family transcriptional regulator